MSLEELESAVAGLPAGELDAFARWFEDYRAGDRGRPGQPDRPVTVSITPRAYFRSMFLLAWMAFRHPFTDTYIDVTRGKVIKP